MSNKQGNSPTKMNVRRSVFDEVRKWDNEQLRSLYKEVNEMGKLDDPRYFKQSKEMKQLFDLEKADYYTWAYQFSNVRNTWAYQFSNVRRAIEREILYRVRLDTW